MADHSETCRDSSTEWRCAGQRFREWESFIRFYYKDMPAVAEWLIQDKRRRDASPESTSD